MPLRLLEACPQQSLSDLSHRIAGEGVLPVSTGFRSRSDGCRPRTRIWPEPRFRGLLAAGSEDGCQCIRVVSYRKDTLCIYAAQAKDTFCAVLHLWPTA